MQRLLVLAIFLPIFAHAAWVDRSGNPLPDTESMRSSGNFGVQIVLTPDDTQFRQAWSRTGPPTLKSTHTVRVGSSVSAMLIFHGCAPSPAGVCDLHVEFALESPDGASKPAGRGPVWSLVPPGPGLLQLGLTNVTVAFDETDPVGEYRVIANVTDRVSGRRLAVAGRLQLAR